MQSWGTSPPDSPVLSPLGRPVSKPAHLMAVPREREQWTYVVHQAWNVARKVLAALKPNDVAVMALLPDIFTATTNVLTELEGNLAQQAAILAKRPAYEDNGSESEKSSVLLR